MRKVALKFLDEESVGSCEERISREVMFKVVEDSLNGGVEADEGLRMVVIHERSSGVNRGGSPEGAHS